MKKGWRVILVIVAICIAFGAVCAGVGVLTGADTDRIGAIVARRCEDRYNLEATNNIYLGNGRRVRGFLGIELLVKPNSF